MEFEIQIGFVEPWSGVYVEGTKTLYARDAADKSNTLKRYAAYLKETYGSGTYCIEGKG